MDGELRATLDAIESDWNSAEEYIKKVERLRRGLVVAASINELRYAGRRLIEAYSLAKQSEKDPSLKQSAYDLLREVNNFCLRARHDAIDGAVTYIDQALAKFEDTFGPDILHQNFPDYIKMKAALREVSEIMSASRGERGNRDLLYKKISDEIVPGLISHHYALETSTKIFEAVYKARVKKEKQDAFRFWLPTVTAILAFIAAALALPPFVKFLEGPPAHAESPAKLGNSLRPAQRPS